MSAVHATVCVVHKSNRRDQGHQPIRLVSYPSALSIPYVGFLTHWYGPTSFHRYKLSLVCYPL